MDQQRAPLPPTIGDVALDDAPGLTPQDETALDAIRRQLEEEYSDAGVPPSLFVESAAIARARGARVGRWPLVAGLVALGTVGGGAIGSVFTAHMLGRPDATVALGVLPERDPVVAPERQAEITPPTLPPQALAGAPAASDRARGPGSRAPSARRVAPADPTVISSPVTVEQVVAVPPGISRRDTFAAPPMARHDAAPERPSPRAASPPTGPSPATPANTPQLSSPVAAPEPQRWSDPFQPLSTETAAHAGVAKAAFRSSSVSSVPPPSPPPPVQPLPPPRTVPEPTAVTPQADRAAKHSPESAREESLLTTVREDWKTVKSGFAAAPEDFRRAWRSLTRDLKDLLDR